jgi:hypothetical protein
MYQKAVAVLKIFFRPDQIFKYGFNISPMYRRSVGKISKVSKDLHLISVEIPLNYKNRNFVGSIFGGSLFSATDPVYMIQLLQILGKEYVVWDKSATIKYKQPARSKVYATFEFTSDEIEDIKKNVREKNQIDILKKLNITTKEGIVIAEVEKVIYVANKEFYASKRKSKPTANDTE